MSTGKKRRLLVWLLSATAVLLAAGGTLWYTGKLPIGTAVATMAGRDSTAVGDALADADKEDDPLDVAVPVELARAERRGIAAYYKAASVIEADRLVDMVSKVTGRVQAVRAEEGDWVASGKILAELENGREKIQLRQADLRLADQRRILERNRQMLAEELISQQEFDDFESAYLQAEADRDLAAIALEETYLRAPFAGQVTDRKIVLGQQVAIGVSTFTLADFEPLRVRVYLPEAVARKIAVDQRVLITPEAGDGPLEARVERVAPVVDPSTSTVRLTLLLTGSFEHARVGGFVKVRITTDSHTDALAIPKLALVEEGGLRSVFVAEADSVRKTEINTGLYDETHVEVLDGLTPGDYVVTLGQGGLRTGTSVDVLNADAVQYVSPAAATDQPGDETVAVAEADR